MNLSTPLILVILAGASYARRDDAVEAFNTARGARRQGGSGYMDVAVLTKDAAGELQAEQHDSTARHYAREAHRSGTRWSSWLPRASPLLRRETLPSLALAELPVTSGTCRRGPDRAMWPAPPWARRRPGSHD